jgi:hypothetical protein
MSTDSVSKMFVEKKQCIQDKRGRKILAEDGSGESWMELIKHHDDN